MELYYCDLKCQQELMRRVYNDVTSHIDTYKLSEKVIGMFNTAGNSYTIFFDPIKVIGDPASFYKQLIPQIFDHKLSYSCGMIDDILRRPLLITETDDAKTDVRNTALDLLDRISTSIVREELTNGPLSQLINQYISMISSGSYSIKKLAIDQVIAKCVEVSQTDIFGMDEKVESKMLIFHLDVIAKEPSAAPFSTFKWTHKSAGPDILYKYLLFNSFIKEIDYPAFEFIFNHKPVDKLPDKIIWIDRGKNHLSTVGLIVDFIYLLSLEGFISDVYRGRQLSNSVIEACFALDDGSPPIVKNKKVTSRTKWTQKIEEFYQFLTDIPPIPS